MGIIKVRKSSAPPISKKVIVSGLVSSISFLFKVENKAAKNAEIKPIIMPTYIKLSVFFTTNIIPGIISKPSPNSNHLTFCFIINGSKSAVKNETVAMQIKQIETFAYFAAPKNVTQCIATKIPMARN